MSADNEFQSLGAAATKALSYNDTLPACESRLSLSLFHTLHQKAYIGYMWKNGKNTGKPEVVLNYSSQTSQNIYANLVCSGSN